jgi:hypothetical protein
MAATRDLLVELLENLAPAVERVGVSGMSDEDRWFGILSGSAGMIVAMLLIGGGGDVDRALGGLDAVVRDMRDRLEGMRRGRLQ